MAEQNVNALKIHLNQFLKESPELASGRVEILGAFEYYMTHVKKITVATEKEFRTQLDEYKTLSV